MRIDKKFSMKSIKLMILHKRENYLKAILNLGRLKSFQILILKAIFIRLKNRINYAEKLNYLNKLFRIPATICKRFLKRSLIRWKDICERIATEEYFNNQDEKRKQLLLDILQKKLLNLHQKYNDKKSFYCRLWSGKIKDKNVKDAVRTINKYVERKFKDLKARKKWIKLLLGKCIKEHKYNMLHINTRIKQYMRFSKLFKLFTTKINLEGFKHLRDKCHLHRVHQKLAIVFGNTQDRHVNMIKYHFWRKWRHVNSNLRLKDLSLLKLATIYNERYGIIGFQTLNDAFSIKKMMVLFKVLKRRRAFEKIKIKSLRNSNFFKLGKALMNCKESHLTDNKNIFMRTLSSVYVFRRLESLSQKVNLIITRVKKESFKTIEEFSYHRFKQVYSSKNNFKRETPKGINLTFSTKKVGNDSNQNVKADHSNDDKNVNIQYVMPYFIKYTQDVLNKRGIFSMEKLKFIFKLGKLEKINNLLNKRDIEISKEMFFNNFNRFVNNISFIRQLKELLRKYTIMKFREECFKPTSKLLKLIYFIRVAKMHNHISDKNYFSAITKNWRFVAHVKRLTYDKMNCLFKNIEGSYLNMGEEIFGKNKNDFKPSLIDDYYSIKEQIDSKENESPILKKKYKFENLIYIDYDNNEKEESKSNDRINKRNLKEKSDKNIIENNRINENSPGKKFKTTRFNV